MNRTTQLPLPPATRAAQRRERARQAAAGWRRDARANGRPTAAKADAAIVEAVSFLLQLRPTVRTVDFGEVSQIAALALKAEGYSKRLSMTVIADRVRAREHHHSLGFVPNLRGVSDPQMVHPPLGGRPWSDDDFAALNRIVGRPGNNTT